MGRFENVGKDALSKVEDLMNAAKLNDLLTKKQDDEKKKNTILSISLSSMTGKILRR